MTIEHDGLIIIGENFNTSRKIKLLRRDRVDFAAEVEQQPEQRVDRAPVAQVPAEAHPQAFEGAKGLADREYVDELLKKLASMASIIVERGESQ